MRLQEEFEDTKGVIISRKSKEIPFYGKKRIKTNKTPNDELENTTHKTIY
jgi:hypothetical protein